MLKKNLWIVVLLAALAIVITGCPEGSLAGSKSLIPIPTYWDDPAFTGGGGGGGDVFDWGPASVVSGVTAWGEQSPTWDAGAKVIRNIRAPGGTGGSSGFSMTWAQMGITKPASQNTVLTIFYAIDVKTPEATLVLVNPTAMATNIWGGDSNGWGIGKGKEYQLGNATTSNYTNSKPATVTVPSDGTAPAILSGKYDDTVKRGFIEVDLRVFEDAYAALTGLGFKHNSYSDLGTPNTQNSKDSVYDLKIYSVYVRDAGCDCDEDMFTCSDCLRGICIGDCGDTCCTGAEAHIPVTNITGVPSLGYVGTPLNLAASANVEPGTATNTTITWSKVTVGSTATFEVTSAGVLTATTGGDAKVLATIVNGLTATTPYTKEFTITIEAPATSMKITVAGDDDVDATVTGTGGTIAYLPAGNGYEFTRTAANDAGYAQFKVDFGTDALGDFAKINFKYLGVSGDVDWKNLNVLASATEFTGAITTGGLIIESAPQYRTDPVTASIDISQKKLKALSLDAESEVYFSFYYAANATGAVGGAGSATVMRIENVEFVKGNPVTITLDEDNGSATYTIILHEGTKYGSELPVPTKTGEAFIGWFTSSNVLITASDLVPAAAHTLTAQYFPLVTVTNEAVTFTQAMFDTDGTVNQGTITIVDTPTTGAGYTFDYGGNYGPYAMFKVTLPGVATLKDYDKVTLTYEVTDGTDVGNKTLRLITSATKLSGYKDEATHNAMTNATASVNGAGPHNSVTFNINKTKAYLDFASAANASEVYIGLYIHCNEITYKVTSFEFIQNP